MEGYVYITSNSLEELSQHKIKIGHAKDVNDRLKSIKTFCPNIVIVHKRKCVNYIQIEGLMHAYFKKTAYADARECFVIDPQVAKDMLDTFVDDYDRKLSDINVKEEDTKDIKTVDELKNDREKRIKKKYQKKIKELREQLKLEKKKVAEYEKANTILTKKLEEAPTGQILDSSIVKKLKNIKCDKIEPLTEELLIKHVPFYTLGIMYRGVPGLVDYIKNITEFIDENGEVQRNYVYISSNIFYRLTEGKIWKRDNGGQFLHTIFDSLRVQIRLNEKEYNDKLIANPGVYNDRYEILKQIERGIGYFSTTDKRNTLFNAVRKEVKQIISI